LRRFSPHDESEGRPWAAFGHPQTQKQRETVVARTTPIERYRNFGIMSHIDAG
jgi:hypothetical protein